MGRASPAWSSDLQWAAGLQQQYRLIMQNAKVAAQCVQLASSSLWYVR